MTDPDRRTARCFNRVRPLALGLLAAAGIGMAQPASAQIDDYGGYLPPAYRYDDGGRYGYAPLPPSGLPPRAIGNRARENFGLARIDRMIRTESSYVVDGRTDAGTRTRLIFDRFSGRMIDRIVLDRPVREPDGRPARVARTDPRERPASPARTLPQPPVRPPELKEPPSQASAPATAIPAAQPAPEPAAPSSPAMGPKAATTDAEASQAKPEETAPPAPAAEATTKPDQPAQAQVQADSDAPRPALPAETPAQAPPAPPPPEQPAATGEITFPPFAPLE